MDGKTVLGITLVATFAAAPAQGMLGKPQSACQSAIAKADTTLLQSELKIRQRCIEANLFRGPGSCPGPDSRALDRAREKAARAVLGSCDIGDFTPDFLRSLGFPGPCADLNPADDFTSVDLQACVVDVVEHRLTGACLGGGNLDEACSSPIECPVSGPDTACAGIVPLQYDPALGGPLVDATRTCQRTIARASTKFLFAVIKSLARCRRDLLDCRIDGTTGAVSCKLSGFSASECATADPGTAAAIAAAATAARAAITRSCTDGNVGPLGFCDPNQPTVAAGVDCLLPLLASLANDPLVARPPEICGDRRRNQPAEECDGTDDGACPGQCGSASGPFGCLCQDVPRQAVIEHAGGDRDDLFGQDGDTTEGGGYVADLWDCEPAGGPHRLCNVGPSCSQAPHAACGPASNPPPGFDRGDEICAAAAQGLCRKSGAGSTGPHCEADVQQWCQTDGDCAPGDRCVTTLDGPPVPLVSGGIGTCVVSTFTEDVVGTTDLVTGEGSVHARRQASVIAGDVGEPCPVCGGFCTGSAGPATSGTRNRCTIDADCAGGATCVTAAICSYGSRMDQPCRLNPPHGGPTPLFGSTSVDCPPEGPSIATIDVEDAVRTTGVATLAPSVACMASEFAGDACAGGANEGRSCLVPGDCPGGTCTGQCFCAGQIAPNGCPPACVGGGADAGACAADSDCPGGFCHHGDCRPDPADTDSVQEGHCTRDPAQQCFVNAGIVRHGLADTPDRVTAAVGCMSPQASVTSSGPLAVTQPETTVVVGF